MKTKTKTRKASKKPATKKKVLPKKTTRKGNKRAAKKITVGATGESTPTRPSIPFPPEIVVPGVAGSLTDQPSLPEIAFYYPNPYWHDVDWAKNLILFFDGIGMLIPNYMEHAAHFDDLAVISGLKERNLFHVFQPETFLDQDAATRLETAMLQIIDSGALEKLQAEKASSFAELSMSRMGFHVAEESANAIFKQLKKRNLARDTEDGVSIPMHSSVRYLILVLLAQILRDNGRRAGFELLPATDRPVLVNALAELLAQRPMPSAEHVISLDLQAVGVDLAAVPIDEILSFRQENRKLYREYTRRLRTTIHELSLMPPDAQNLALEGRQESIADLASDIRKTSRKAWKKPATFCLSAAGAIWKLVEHDLVGASIAGAAALLSLGKRDSVNTGAYSYLFSARDRFM